MVQRVADLIRRQPYVHCLQRSPQHRGRKHAFQIAVAVPIHDGHRIPHLDAEPRKQAGQAGDPLTQLAIAVAGQIAIDDLALGCSGHSMKKELLEQQRVAGRRHGVPPDAGNAMPS